MISPDTNDKVVAISLVSSEQVNTRPLTLTTILVVSLSVRQSIIAPSLSKTRVIALDTIKLTTANVPMKFNSYIIN